MSLSVIPLTILGQITGITGSGDTVLYQVSFKSIDGTPLYGVTAVWTDEQAEIEALAAQKPYGIWINPIDGTFTVKFAGYTYVGSADLTDDDVLAGITKIEFDNTSGGGGESDFTTCQVTLINNSEEQYVLMVACADIDNENTLPAITSGGFQSQDTAAVILYKGEAYAAFTPDMIPPSADVSVTGDIDYNSEDKSIYITGDGTITIAE